jgi:hypothetical protein
MILPGRAATTQQGVAQSTLRTKPTHLRTGLRTEQALDVNGFTNL